MSELYSNAELRRAMIEWIACEDAWAKTLVMSQVGAPRVLAKKRLDDARDHVHTLARVLHSFEVERHAKLHEAVKSTSLELIEEMERSAAE